MSADLRVRRALWISAFANFGAALLFLFPGSLGALAGLPAPVQRFYALLLALFVALFGAMYAWQARATALSRPLLLIAGIGKTCAFLVAAACWVLQEVPARTAAVFSADLLLGAVFLHGYWSGRAMR